MDSHDIDPIDLGRARDEAGRGNPIPLAALYLPVLESRGRVSKIDEPFLSMLVMPDAIAGHGVNITIDDITRASGLGLLMDLGTMIKESSAPTDDDRAVWLQLWQGRDYVGLYAALHKVGLDYEVMPEDLAIWVRQAQSWRPQRGRKSADQVSRDTMFKPWFVAKLRYERAAIKAMIKRSPPDFTFVNNNTLFSQQQGVIRTREALDLMVSRIQAIRWGLGIETIDDYTKRNRR